MRQVFHLCHYPKNKVNVNAVAAKAGGETALHIAVETGNYEIAELLMKFGADYTLDRNPWSKLPMHIAIEGDDAKMVALLLDNGVDVNDASSIWGSYLHIAASENGLESAKVLVAQGAKLDADYDGSTPLETAQAMDLRHDKTELIAFLKSAS